MSFVLSTVQLYANAFILDRMIRLEEKMDKVIDLLEKRDVIEEKPFVTLRNPVFQTIEEMEDVPEELVSKKFNFFI